MTGLRIATYNIHACVGSDKRFDPERVLHVLHEINADILALQEVGGHPVNDSSMDQAHFFAERLGMTAVKGLHPCRRRIHFGNVVLAKGEVLESNLVDLSIYRFEPRNAIDCLVKTAAGQIRVVATHLGLFSPERKRQISRLKAMLGDQDTTPTVVLGDFNVYGLERRVLYALGAPRPLPTLRSFPARRPIFSLDRLWTLPNNCLSDLHIHRTALSRVASDHLPLIGTVTLPA